MSDLGSGACATGSWLARRCRYDRVQLEASRETDEILANRMAVQQVTHRKATHSDRVLQAIWSMRLERAHQHHHQQQQQLQVQQQQQQQQQ